jgi:hypothetical protein
MNVSSHIPPLPHPRFEGSHLPSTCDCIALSAPHKLREGIQRPRSATVISLQQLHRMLPFWLASPGEPWRPWINGSDQSASVRSSLSHP